MLKKDGSFEVREYSTVTLVTTAMTVAESDEKNNGSSFMRLFGYIARGNEDNQKIAMTSPVLVGDPDGDGRDQMSFIVPEKVAAVGAPKPSSDDVSIETFAGGAFAVYQFRGAWKKTGDAAHRAKLADWLKTNNLEPAVSFAPATTRP